MDVKFEDENVVRHLDITTHNHASFPGNSPTWPFIDEQAFVGEGPCAGVANDVTKDCLETKKGSTGQEVYKHVYVYQKVGVVNEASDVKRKESIEAMCANKECAKALKCVLSPKDPSNCCPQPQPSPPTTTGHHVVPDSKFYKKAGGTTRVDFINPDAEYSYNAAPCFCAKGVSHSVKQHGKIHRATNRRTLAAKGVGVPGKKTKQFPANATWSVGAAERVGAEAVEEVTGCDADCIEQQVRKEHRDMKIRKDDKIRPTTAGDKD